MLIVEKERGTIHLREIEGVFVFIKYPSNKIRTDFEPETLIKMAFNQMTIK
jgi:hypothetical protein